MITQSIDIIVPLADAQKSRRAGGKAINLSKLIAAHFAVPRGFVLSADAYRSHLWASGAREIASAQADAEAREAVREAILGQTMPEDVWKSVAEAYKWLAWQTGLQEPKVAVRASAIEHNAEGLGFSGAYESYLNVCGLDALHEAIKRVWASLWSGKAAAYRIRSRAEAEPAMAVIVQQMVETDLVGTASTANPVTGDPQGVVVTARKGDESSRYRVDLRDLRVEQTDGLNAVGDEGLIRQIAEQSILIEDVIEGRVEIEWAYDRDGLWILQADPMAELPSFFPVDRCNQNDGGIARTRQSKNTISWLARSLTEHSKQVVINGYLYTSPEDKADDAALREWDKRVRPGCQESISGILDADLAVLDHPGLLRAIDCAADAARESYKWMRRAEWASEHFSALVSELVEDRRLAWRLLGGVKDALFERDALLQELSDRFAIAERSGKLDDESWWRGYKRDVERFAREYGYAFQNTEEAVDPARWRSWIEDTDPIFRIIGAISKCGANPTLVTLHCAAEQDALNAENEAFGKLAKGRQANLKRLLEPARGRIRVSAETELDCALAATAFRLLVMELARRLQCVGVIASAGDIFNLSLEEILGLPPEPDAVELATLIARRKHDGWLERRLIPPETLPINDNVSQPGDGMGTAAGTGLVTGRARLVSTIEDASEIERGDILVIASPSLAWTPFLAFAGGLVCGSGHGMSPLAVTARVYGIPAVMGCSVIPRDGKRITVDGDAGMVKY